MKQNLKEEAKQHIRDNGYVPNGLLSQETVVELMVSFYKTNPCTPDDNLCTR